MKKAAAKRQWQNYGRCPDCSKKGYYPVYQLMHGRNRIIMWKCKYCGRKKRV